MKPETKKDILYWSIIVMLGAAVLILL